jgi:5S rRNA maturation endonuclease (ribonuclease M5)
MKKEVVEILLPLLNSKATGMRGGKVEAHCVLGAWNHENGVDAHPSMYISVSDINKSKVKCWSCGFHGDLMDLAMAVAENTRLHKDPRYQLAAAMELIANEYDEVAEAGIPEYKEGKDIYTPTEVIYPDSWLDSFQGWGLFEDAIAYLNKRGVPLFLADKMDLRFDPFERRVVFPFRNFNGRLMGAQGRAIDEDNTLRYMFYKYGDTYNMHPWLGEHHVDLDKPVVLVEGPFDYASVRRVYDNVLASFSCGIGYQKIHRLQDAAQIITLYDAGKGGNSARNTIEKYHKGEIIHIVPNSADIDAGAMTLPQIRGVLNEHVTLKK